MKSIIFLLVFIQSLGLVYSQNFWNRLQTPTGGTINEIKFLNDSILVAHNDTKLFLCNRNDYHWQVQEINKIDGEQIHLDTIYTFGVSNNVLYLSINFMGGDVAGPGIIYSKDRGKTWESFCDYLFCNYNCYHIEIADNIFFVGNDEGVSISNDSCKTFTENNLKGNKVIDLTKSPNGEVWALIENTGIFKYLAGSDKWEFISSVNFSANSLSVDKDGNIIISSDDEIHISTDNGSSWEVKKIDNFQINSLALDGYGNSYLCTETNGVLISNDNRENWNKINDGLSAYEFTAIEYLPSKELIVATKNKGIFKSSDNGQTWFNISHSGSGIRKFYKDYNNIIYGLGDNFLYFTTNNGKSWRNIYTPDINQIAFTKNNEIFGLSSELGIYKLQNGIQWVKIENNKIPDDILSSITITKNDRIIIGGFNNLISSDDYGKNWDLFQIQDDFGRINHLRTNEKNYIIATANTGNICYSLKGGDLNSWNYINFIEDDITYGNYVAVEFTNDNQIYYSFSSLYGQLQEIGRIKDFHRPKDIIESGLEQLFITDFAFDDQGYVYSCTGEGIYKSKDIVLGVNNESQEQLSIDVSAYPIPCNDILNVKINNNISGKYSVSLLNLYGVNVKNIIQKKYYSRGKISIKADLTGIIGGIYFLQIRNGNYFKNYKIIKLGQ